MEAANSARSLPYIDYQPVHEGEPSHRPEQIPSPHYTDCRREVPRSNRSGRSHMDQLGRRAVRGHPMLPRLPPMTAPPKPQNAQKYYEFHEQSGHTTTEYRELKKALHELADKGQIDRFLRKGPRFLRREPEPAQPQPRDEECSTEIMAMIVGGYEEGITRSAWKAQLRNTQQEVNPTGMIRLPVRFGDKIKSKNLEVDFLVVDVPTAYNVILGRPTLHKRGLRSRSIWSPPPGRLETHGRPLHQPAAEAALPSVNHLRPIKDGFILSTVKSYTTPSSTASFSSIATSPVLFRGAQSRLPHLRPQTIKSMGRRHGSAPLVPNEGLPHIIGHLPRVVDRRERHNSKGK
ncbi:LOW QUALITY PROTEIN: hypothetical protein Cgig2_015271 [Carnegiea gigantea]|uniref:Uncharacterized protein n=1 Tax=Carnegiea gigantea TaxID=171969 RepID=A0A9Q1GJP3_9CARY|nr:LOW QUALITY PROTEIN: hypothetical protein Cgig2_015271 [Carnegiea gigantea]